MAKNIVGPSREILQAALQGLEAQREKLDGQISQVRAMMGQRTVRPGRSSSADTSGIGVPRKKRILSAEARKRIAAAQKKRWAAFRKSHQ